MKSTGAVIVALALLASPALADKKLDDAIAKSDEQVLKGKPEEAVKTLQKVVDQNPASSEARLAFARLQERLGNFEEAVLQAAKAVEVATTPQLRSQALAHLSSLDLLRGSGKDALAHADEGVKAEASAAALAALARAQARVGEAGKALETADRAAQAGSSGVAHEARGEALLALHRAEEAVAAYRKALEVDPKLNRARVGLASALIVQGKAGEAIAEARKASEVDAKSAEAFAALGRAILAESPKNWNEAIAQAQQGAFLNPKSVIVQMAVGEIFEAAGNIDQAGGAYRRALEADPGCVPARFGLTNILSRKDLDGALAEAKKLTAEVPGSAEAHLLLGRLLLRKNDFEGSVPALKKAVEIAPKAAEAWAFLGTAYQYTGESDDAADSYKKAVELDPGSLEYRTTYGLLLGIVKEHEAGIAELKKVVANPAYKKADAWINLGWIYRNTDPKRIEESLAAYKKALEIDPKNAQSALGMGWDYSYAKTWDQSIASFEKAMALDPKLAGEAYNGIAWCHYFKEDMTKAKEFMEKARTAGRNVAGLRSSIDRYEKALAAGQAAAAKADLQKEQVQADVVDLGALVNQLGSKDVGTRRKAATNLRELGREAVPYLTPVLRTEPNRGVREAAVRSLTRVGVGSAEACNALKAYQASPNEPPTVATKAELDEWLKEDDFRKRVLKEGIAKVCR